MPTANKPEPAKSQPKPDSPAAQPEHTREELDALLDEAIDESFPASDPPSVHRRPD